MGDDNQKKKSSPIAFEQQLCLTQDLKKTEIDAVCPFHITIRIGNRSGRMLTFSDGELYREFPKPLVARLEVHGTNGALHALRLSVRVCKGSIRCASQRHPFTPFV